MSTDKILSGPELLLQNVAEVAQEEGLSGSPVLVAIEAFIGGQKLSEDVLVAYPDVAFPDSPELANEHGKAVWTLLAKAQQLFVESNILYCELNAYLRQELSAQELVEIVGPQGTKQ